MAPMTLVSHAKTPRVVSRALLLAAVVTAREPSDTSTIHVNATGAWGSPADRFTVPVFVKLHKVGSTTIFELFECLQHITDLLPPLGDVFPPAAAQTRPRATRRRTRQGANHAPEAATEAACHAALNRPWMHETQTFFRLARADGLARCFELASASAPEPAGAPTTAAARRPTPRSFGAPAAVSLVLLRRPLDRVVSALMFFHPQQQRGVTVKGAGRGNPHKVHARSPRLVEAADVERAIAALWPDRFDAEQAQHAGTLFEYVDTLAGPSRWREGKAGASTPPTPSSVAAANASLARDFVVVGVTEEMDAFKALAALALGWPPSLMCNAPANRNAFASKTDDIGAGARARLEALLAPEAAVYARARELHEAQAAAFGAAFERARAVVAGARDDGACAEAAAARSARAVRMLARKRIEQQDKSRGSGATASPSLARCMPTGTVGHTEALREAAIKDEVGRLRAAAQSASKDGLPS